MRQLSGNFHYVTGLRSFLSLDNFKFYLVAFLKALVSFRGDRAVMHKDIRTIFTSDKSKTFCIVEPLYSSLETSHLLPPCVFRSATLPAVSIGVGLASSDLVRELLNFGGTPVLDLISKIVPQFLQAVNFEQSWKPLFYAGSSNKPLIVNKQNYLSVPADFAISVDVILLCCPEDSGDCLAVPHLSTHHPLHGFC